jgi:ABC-type antimicrobial peptide transport system permease subunit
VGTTVYRVVGIARDTRHLTISETDQHFFYAPIRFDESNKGMQFTRPQTLIVYSTNSSSLPTDVQHIARELDPSVLLTVMSLQGRLVEALEPARMVALCSGILGFLALLLAVMGVYSAVAYAVNQRWHEIGVRFALGASRRDIVLLVLRQGRTAVLGGIGVGLLLAVAAGQVVRGAVYGLQPLDPIAFIGMTALLGAAALLAMLRPARRAAALDPAVTLRGE